MNHFTRYFLMFNYSRVLFLNFSIFHITLFRESNTKKAPFLPVPSNNKNRWETLNYKGCLLNTLPFPAHMSVFPTSTLLKLIVEATCYNPRQNIVET